ncbi:hypothetical protein [Paraglaciecola sp. MB-3u-78]|uniref:hypothetical protein n=1 Tax=Paraglaciecola sp. MB-3u-78 TaxID=2058332 RepID=UPI0012FE8AEC|nr:hypothetical protein [Paraglaciecola sp. MB-3u-78]
MPSSDSGNNNSAAADKNITGKYNIAAIPRRDPTQSTLGLFLLKTKSGEEITILMKSTITHVNTKDGLHPYTAVFQIDNL